MGSMVDLAKPIRFERERVPWARSTNYFVYRCPEGHEFRVVATAYSGLIPVPATGAIRCPECQHEEQINSMKWIRGDELNESQRRQVLDAFGFRWTHENAARRYGGRCPACAQDRGQFERSKAAPNSTIPDGQTWHETHVPLVSDAEWLASRKFAFVAKGTRLAPNVDYCDAR